MKEKVLEVLKNLGFNCEELDDWGYGFKYEGASYFYIPNEDDDEFLSLCVPGIQDFEEDNASLFYQWVDKLNTMFKYVKAHKVGDSMWLFYERECIGEEEDLRTVITRMIYHLEASLFLARKVFAAEEGEATDGEANDPDVDETTEDND